MEFRFAHDLGVRDVGRIPQLLQFDAARNSLRLAVVDKQRADGAVNQVECVPGRCEATGEDVAGLWQMSFNHPFAV